MNEAPGQVSDRAAVLEAAARSCGPLPSRGEGVPLTRPLLWAVLVSVVMVNIPRTVTGIDLDSSWCSVRAFAHSERADTTVRHLELQPIRAPEGTAA